MKLSDIPYGDYYQIIYRTKEDDKPRVYITCNPHQDENGKYYEVTFEDIIKEIEEKNDCKISHFIMLAEFGLDGKVYRYNNHRTGELYECGETKGYA